MRSSSGVAPRSASAEIVDDSAAVLPSNGASTDALFGSLDDDLLPVPWEACQSSSSSTSPESCSWTDDLLGFETPELLRDAVSFEETVQIGKSLWPEVTVPAYLNDNQVQYVLRALRSFVPSLAYTGSTPFLHQHLWRRDHQPEAYQDCVALSALYLCKTSANSAVITDTIDSKIAKLTASSHKWTLKEHFAAVQTLIIYQIMRLFDPSLNAQSQAQAHNALLEVWAAELWKRSAIEPTMLATCYETWVFNESLRRTVLMAVFVRCAWSTHTRGGLASQIPVLARIPFTKDVTAWKVQSEEWESSVLPGLLEQDGLTVYTDFSDQWKREDELESLDPFGRLLMAACRGGDDPRLLE